MEVSIMNFEPLTQISKYSKWNMRYEPGESITFFREDDERKKVIIEIIFSKSGIENRLIKLDYKHNPKNCAYRSKTIRCNISGNGSCIVSEDNPSFMEGYIKKLIKGYGISSVEFLNKRSFRIDEYTSIILPGNTSCTCIGTDKRSGEGVYESITTPKSIKIDSSIYEGSIYLTKINKFVIVEQFGERILYTANRSWGINRYLDWLSELRVSGIIGRNERRN